MTSVQAEKFEKALLIAYIEAARSDPSATVLGSSGLFSHVVIEPADSAFARWLVDQEIGVVTEAGQVALPYGGGSDLRASVLAHSLIVRVRGLTGTQIIGGKQPPAAHWAGLERLRERYALPTMVAPGTGLPEQLLV